MQKGKRTRRTKEQIEADKSKGLGDTVEKVFKATGIDKVAKFVLGEDCGCDERKEYLNKIFPYNKPNCLTEDEYQWLDNYYTKGANQVTPQIQEEFLVIYNRVMNDKQMPTSCSSCFKEWHLKLNKVYLNYKTEEK